MTSPETLRAGMEANVINFVDQPTFGIPGAARKDSKARPIIVGAIVDVTLATTYEDLLKLAQRIDELKGDNKKTEEERLPSIYASQKDKQPNDPEVEKRIINSFKESYVEALITAQLPDYTYTTPSALGARKIVRQLNPTTVKGNSAEANASIVQAKVDFL